MYVFVLCIQKCTGVFCQKEYLHIHICIYFFQICILVCLSRYAYTIMSTQLLLTPVYIVFAPGVCFCRWWIGWSTGSHFSHRVSRWSRYYSRKGSLSFGSFPNDRFLPWEAPDLLLLVNHHYERYFCDVTWQDTGNQHMIVTLIAVYVLWLSVKELRLDCWAS